jgi:hypothetical protein
MQLKNNFNLGMVERKENHTCIPFVCSAYSRAHFWLSETAYLEVDNPVTKKQL